MRLIPRCTCRVQGTHDRGRSTVQARAAAQPGDTEEALPSRPPWPPSWGTEHLPPPPTPRCLGPSTPHPSQFLAGPQLLRQVPPGGRGSDPGFQKAGSLCKPTLPKPKQQWKAGAPLLPTGSRCSTLQGTALVR